MRNKIHRQKTSIENIIPTAAIFSNWENCEDFMRGTIGLLYPRKHMAT